MIIILLPAGAVNNISFSVRPREFSFGAFLLLVIGRYPRFLFTNPKLLIIIKKDNYIFERFLYSYR
jgi:hypothetical protein